MKAQFTASLGKTVVAYIDVLPFGYLMCLKDGRRIHASSLQEYRDAGYTVKPHGGKS